MRIVAAVLGSPIAHSKSPLLHRAAFAALGMASSEYSRFELGADDLESFLDSSPDHTGFSLTMPLKDRLVTLAAERGWSVDETAALTAAGNTLVRRDGQVQVTNTDVEGIVRAISAHTDAEVASAGAGRATILGAGATAASALVACHDLGITHVDFRVRSPDRARRVLDLAERIGLTASVGDLTRLGASRFVISTLPAEAAPDPVWDDSFTAGDIALDVAYAGASTFLAAAAAHGLRPVSGTAMLVEQAVAQFEMFLGAARAAAGDAEEGLATDTQKPGLRDRITHAMYSALSDQHPSARA
ncbi:MULTISPECIES: shikimate dehydrogenase family protein [unclassified Brevibacterium]|uniref:shikimate dehydrogenase family protein n=1 Tax=unclassified Brevibacterium TaxID=2614124 RepID=UPI001091FDE6|nr:shikimate dehydrogenase [Brevibacterium sp. S22]TGD32398.1 shikimate dehydrogenase [Brevibacterium sp. S22]